MPAPYVLVNKFKLVLSYESSKLKIRFAVFKLCVCAHVSFSLLALLSSSFGFGGDSNGAEYMATRGVLLPFPGECIISYGLSVCFTNYF